MTSLTRGDVVWVPFPHVEDNRLRPRPAIIIATGLGGALGLCWSLMVTSAANRAWPGDITIADHQAVGLPIQSRIRTAKVATLEEASAKVIGRLPPEIWAQVTAHVRDALA